MKRVGKALLWILGIFTWLTFLETFVALEIEHKIHALYIYLIISGILLAIYIWKKTGSGTKELEKENQELKAEIQKLRQELAEQTVQHAMDKAESRERKG